MVFLIALAGGVVAGVTTVVGVRAMSALAVWWALHKRVRQEHAMRERLAILAKEERKAFIRARAETRKRFLDSELFEDE